MTLYPTAFSYILLICSHPIAIHDPSWATTYYVAMEMTLTPMCWIGWSVRKRIAATAVWALYAAHWRLGLLVTVRLTQRLGRERELPCSRLVCIHCVPVSCARVGCKGGFACRPIGTDLVTKGGRERNVVSKDIHGIPKAQGLSKVSRVW